MYVLLHWAQLNSNNELSLGGHVFENISLQPPEHVWSQHVMQLLDLVLFGNVRKLLEKPLQVTAARKEKHQ